MGPLLRHSTCTDDLCCTCTMGNVLYTNCSSGHGHSQVSSLPRLEFLLVLTLVVGTGVQSVGSLPMMAFSLVWSCQDVLTCTVLIVSFNSVLPLP